MNSSGRGDRKEERVAKIPIKELTEAGKRLDEEDVPTEDRQYWDGEKFVKVEKGGKGDNQ